MNKSDLINEVAKVVETKKAAQRAVDSVFLSITQALKNEVAVTVTGFGTFKVQRRQARKGRNPRTGVEIEIKARNVAKFIPGKALKTALN
jgi:DNA-binding protein HU-beta